MLYLALITSPRLGPFVHERDGMKPGAWWGEASAALDLRGAVDAEVLERLLDGQVPGEEGWLDLAVSETRKRRRGWDLTFSAPKSVSIMAEAIGDERLGRAHETAVRAALRHLEDRHALTRLRVAEGRVVRRHTGNVAAAVFRGSFNYNGDPHLHSRVILLNLTKTERGWRGLHSIDVFRQKKAIGMVYRQELALRARSLGYEIAASREGTFEIEAVEPSLCAAFSTRREEVTRWLESYGIAPGETEGALSERAAIATQRRKGTLDRERLVEAWRATLGAEADRLAKVHVDTRAGWRWSEGEWLMPGREQSRALSAVSEAISELAQCGIERSVDALVETASRCGLGYARRGAIERAVGEAIRGRWVASRWHPVKPSRFRPRRRKGGSLGCC